MSHRSWVFTLNNYTNDDINHITERFKLLCNVLYASYEVCPTTLTPHIQGFFTLKRPKRLPGLKKILGDRYHFEKANGDKDDQLNYIFKDGSTELIKYDNGGQGKRNDITDFMDQWKSCGKRAAVTGDVATYVKYHKGLERAWQVMNEPDERDQYPNVVWLYGPTGIGKTKFGKDKSNKNYTIICNYPWFDGYLNQPWVIFDEIEKWETKISPHHLLQLLDCYKMLVPIKGGFTNWNPPNILITSSHRPEIVFPGIWDQLERRICKLATKDKYEEEYRFTIERDPLLLQD